MVKTATPKRRIKSRVKTATNAIMSTWLCLWGPQC